MRFKKIILSALFLLAVGLTGIKAQSQLFVKEKAGTVTSYDLSNIKKLNFTEGNLMVVDKMSGGSTSYALTNLRNLSFAPFTGIKDPVGRGKNTISLYPNPVRDEFKLSYKSNTTANIQVEIVDLQGRVLQRQIISGQNGTINQESISVSQLVNGIYLCRLFNGDRIENVKFIKK